MNNLKNKYNMKMSDNVLYAKRNIIDSIYSEARLEGIGVTYPDTMEIYEGRAVAGLTIEETMKINNLKHGWNFILNNLDYPLDLRFIRQVNSEIGKGIVLNEGQLRTLDVKIGGTSWKPSIPDEQTVMSEINTIIFDKEKSYTEKAIEVMLYIMRCQLFMDGNKRTAQIVANKVMIENGAGIINIPVDLHKEFFIHLVEYYETNDMSFLKNWVYENCIDGINPVYERNLEADFDVSSEQGRGR